LFNSDSAAMAKGAIHGEEINQHLFKPEYIFRNPAVFDSFIFGSSRIAVINPSQINTGKFYNMSYSEGLPAEHLAIIKSFLRKGIKIKTIMIGLDEFSFSITPQQHKDQLLRIMHPETDDINRIRLFYLYYFRTPQLLEYKIAKNKFLNIKKDNIFHTNENGFILGWMQKEQIIQAEKKPLFVDDKNVYQPACFSPENVDAAFGAMEELISVAKKNNISLIFFFNPLHHNLYSPFAAALLPIKERFVGLTDFYDFSGFNSITMDNMNYYETSHYRYSVGDMMINKMFGDSNAQLPRDFGVFVTKKNIAEHLKNQRKQLEDYLTAKGMKK
jgi:hypothetical protein